MDETLNALLNTGGGRLILVMMFMLVVTIILLVRQGSSNNAKFFELFTALSADNRENREDIDKLSDAVRALVGINQRLSNTLEPLLPTLARLNQSMESQTTALLGLTNKTGAYHTDTVERIENVGGALANVHDDVRKAQQLSADAVADVAELKTGMSRIETMLQMFNGYLDGITANDDMADVGRRLDEMAAVIEVVVGSVAQLVALHEEPPQIGATIKEDENESPLQAGEEGKGNDVTRKPEEISDVGDVAGSIGVRHTGDGTGRGDTTA